MIFPLTNDDKARLQRLNQDSTTREALKKLFFNTCTTKPFTSDTYTLASDRIAIEHIRRTFEELESISPQTGHGELKENLV